MVINPLNCTFPLPIVRERQNSAQLSRATPRVCERRCDGTEVLCGIGRLAEDARLLAVGRAAAVVVREIQVQVVGVVAVGAGTEHGLEDPAGAAADLT